jgi:dGTPase
MNVPASRAGPDLAYGAGLVPGQRAIASYAASAVASRGRLVDEAACPMRSDWQRDRDRILHCGSFRRLMYKTQMFVFHEGDTYRTRLTHSLEVAQIARTLARQLLLDEDLAEALALAHDLGHPPFGHAGERALDRLVAPVGGFDHNVQSFRIVTRLETRYARYDGLNLTWESLEGLIKHNGPPAGTGKARDERVVRALRRFQSVVDLELDQYASGEAQVAALADDIAWHTHDIDDGLRAGLIELADLGDVELLVEELRRIEQRPSRDRSRDIYELVRALITRLVADVLAETRRRLAELAPREPDDIRGAGRTLVAFSPDLFEHLKVLRAFLFERLYHHSRVMRVMNNAEAIVEDLVTGYASGRNAMPEEWTAAGEQLDEAGRLRLVCDFVAGMTDRYAIGQHQRWFDATPQLR